MLLFAMLTADAVDEDVIAMFDRYTSVAVLPNAAPCARIGLTLLNTSAIGVTPRSIISRSIQAEATPPFAVLNTRILPT